MTDNEDEDGYLGVPAEVRERALNKARAMLGPRDSNFMTGASHDGDAATHGGQTALYQDLIVIRQKYDAWVASARKYHEFYNDEMDALAGKISDDLDTLALDINQPL